MSEKAGIAGRCRHVPRCLLGSAKGMAPLLMVVAVLSGFREGFFSADHMAGEAPPILITLVIGWLSGVVAGVVLMPWLPGERASFKGVMAGGLGLLVWPAACGMLHLRPVDVGMALVLVPVLASYWLMRVSGGIGPVSGAADRRDGRVALVIQAVMAGVAFLPWIWLRFV